MVTGFCCKVRQAVVREERSEDLVPYAGSRQAAE